MDKTVPMRRQFSLLRSTTVVSLITFISRVTGFMRDILIAHLFGAEAAIDAFFVAFKIPNFMRRLFAEGAFSQAFVPVLAEYQQKESEAKIKRFISHISGNLLTILFAITLLAVFFSPSIISVFAPGFDKDASRYHLAYTMLKLTAPYLMLISMTALCSAVLNTYGYFAIPALTPVLLNLCLMGAAVWLAPFFSVPVMALALGVLIAGFAQLFFQLPFLTKTKLFVWPQLDFKDKGVRRVLKLMVPALFGVSVAQINLLIDTIFASFLPIGSVSWLYYSDRFVNFPLGVFGVAIATVILPHLSRRHADACGDRFSKSLDWGIRLVLLIGLPSFVSLFLFGKPLVLSLLTYGHFHFNDATMTSLSLSAFALGVPFFMLVKVLASGFYATQNIKTPVKVAAISMITNTILCFILIKPFAHVGLALASSLSGIINASLLLFLLQKKGVYQRLRGWGRYLLQLMGANLILGVFLYSIRGSGDDWYSLYGLIRISYLALDVSLGVIIYLAALFVLGLRLKHFRIS